MNKDPERLAPGIRESGDLVAALIRDLRERYPTQGEAIVFGFSQGGG